MTLDQMKSDLASRNKRGLPFILASVVLWTGILIVWILPLENILTRNLFTFFCTAPLVPLAFFFSKLLKAEFSAKDNPLNNLGLLFSLNQFLYILIAMWAYAAAPENMVMVLAMVFGAHLLPFAWLYQSKAYFVMSVVIPLTTLIVGYGLPEERVFVLAALMLAFEIVFVLWLGIEIKGQKSEQVMATKKTA